MSSLDGKIQIQIFAEANEKKPTIPTVVEEKPIKTETGSPTFGIQNNQKVQRTRKRQRADSTIANSINEIEDISDKIEWCPIFRPSAEEFADFNAYIKKCCSQIGSTGIFKVR